MAKNFGGDVSERKCYDHFFVSELDFGTLRLLRQLFFLLIFLKFPSNVTPNIFCHLVNKISFLGLSEDIFYKQPVFTNFRGFSVPSRPP